MDIIPKEIKDRVAEVHHNYLGDIADKHGFACLRDICGVYMIENPLGQKYVGSSKQMSARWHAFRIIKGGVQTKIQASIVEHGLENHKFTVLEICDVDILRDREAYWGKVFNVLTDGLNGQLPKNGEDKSYCTSKETKDKQSKAASNRGFLYSERRKRAISAASKARPCTAKTKEAISIANTGKKRSAEVVENMRKIWDRRRSDGTGSPSQEVRDRISATMKGRVFSAEHKANLITKLKQRGEDWKKNLAAKNKERGVLVLDLASGIFYDSVAEAAYSYNIRRQHLSRMLSGTRKNKTSLRRA